VYILVSRVKEYRKIEKGKQSHDTPTRAMGVRWYRSYSFSTSALDEAEWSASSSGRAIPRGNDLWYPLDRRLGRPQSKSGHTG
jgi:hypothetical protein